MMEEEEEEEEEEQDKEDNQNKEEDGNALNAFKSNTRNKNGGSNTNILNWDNFIHHNNIMIFDHWNEEGQGEDHLSSPYTIHTHHTFHPLYTMPVRLFIPLS